MSFLCHVFAGVTVCDQPSDNQKKSSDLAQMGITRQFQFTNQSSQAYRGDGPWPFVTMVTLK